jgi:hypothetical protein
MFFTGLVEPAWHRELDSTSVGCPASEGNELLFQRYYLSHGCLPRKSRALMLKPGFMPCVLLSRECPRPFYEEGLVA